MIEDFILKMNQHGERPDHVEDSRQVKFSEARGREENGILRLQPLFREFAAGFDDDLGSNVEAGVVAPFQVVDDWNAPAKRPAPEIEKGVRGQKPLALQEADLEGAFFLPEPTRSNKAVAAPTGCPACLHEGI